MKRVLALVVAVALVAGAYYARTRLIDKKSTTDVQTDRDRQGGGRALVACEPELVDVCRALAGAGVQATTDPLDLDGAQKASGSIAAWLTYGPAPAMVNAAATQRLFGAGLTVGQARLAVVTSPDRALALSRRCGEAKLTWTCLIRFAGTSWDQVAPGQAALVGTVKVGVGRPTTGLGTILLGPAAAATARVADPGVDDIDTSAVRRLSTSGDPADTSDELRTIITVGFGAYSAVVAPEGAARRAVTTPQGQSRGLVVIYPEPVARTVVVLSPPSGRDIPRRLADAVRAPNSRSALSAAGWAPGPGGATVGLPAPDVLVGVRAKIG